MIGSISHQITRFPLVALVGPTAAGKTDLSLRLAKEICAEIISVDSVQVFRGLDIGTAKPGPEEQQQVPHHMIDVADPDEPFDVADFVHKALGIIRSMTSRGKVPLLVGGSGLYLRSLLEGLAPCPGHDPVVREMLRKILSNHGKRALHDILARADPEAASRLHPNDTFRVIRALEVYHQTGEPISKWHRRHKSMSGQRLPCIKIGLVRPREELYERIDSRVDYMLDAGLLEEVELLLNKGYSHRLKPDEAVSQLRRDTRHYAKRQLTWFRADPEIRWYHPEALTDIYSIWHKIRSDSAEKTQPAALLQFSSPCDVR
ncbi:MAG: tRNA (adenosine(37)-N6)-dimethylallyltransferase MiaA [Deltaproteobacteria bacterium]|nr:tRNA (adenosine(37)-N6)-dimethylallyltransferase MiaA [Deltaproteobacteria bacterium]